MNNWRLLKNLHNSFVLNALTLTLIKLFTTHTQAQWCAWSCSCPWTLSLVPTRTSQVRSALVLLLLVLLFSAHVSIIISNESLLHCVFVVQIWKTHISNMIESVTFFISIYTTGEVSVLEMFKQLEKEGQLAQFPGTSKEDKMKVLLRLCCFVDRVCCFYLEILFAHCADDKHWIHKIYLG